MGWYRHVLTMFLKGNSSYLSGELIIAPRAKYDLPSNTLRSFLFLVVEEELLRNEVIVPGPALPHHDGSGHQVSQVDPITGHLALQTGLHGPNALSQFSRPQLLCGLCLT